MCDREKKNEKKKGRERKRERERERERERGKERVKRKNKFLNRERKRASETPPITSICNVSLFNFRTILYNVPRETKYKLFSVEH